MAIKAGAADLKPNELSNEVCQCYSNESSMCKMCKLNSLASQEFLKNSAVLQTSLCFS